jgi:hypothetical protein
MKRIKARKSFTFFDAMAVAVVVLAALIAEAPANAFAPPPPSPDPSIDPDKTVTLNSDGTYSCGPGYTLASSGSGCRAK